MRIVTWNCYRGDIAERLSRLEPLNADFVALQECSKPAIESPFVRWRGPRSIQGVALVDRRKTRTLSLVNLPSDVPATVIAAHIAAPELFVW